MKKINILLVATLFSTLINAQSSGSVASATTTQTTNSRSQFSDFNLTEKGNTVQLDWTAVIEKDMRLHEVQRSTNGSVFTAIGTVTAQNNSSTYRYTFLDATPASSVNYYRLRSVSNSGDVTFSSILQVDLGVGKTDIRVIGNPARAGVINLQLDNLDRGKYAIRLISSGGQQVYNMSLDYSGGSSTEIINLPGNVGRGMYYLQVTNGTTTRLNKLVTLQ